MIIITADGSHSIQSEEFAESYHSKYGAIAESQHVFIDQGLCPLLDHSNTVQILEIGFGTGLNAYLTMLKSPEHMVEYTAVEYYPIDMHTAGSLNYSDELKQDTQPFLDLHQAPWEIFVDIRPNFKLRKIHRKFQDLDFDDSFNLIYYDAFAPNAQAELWTEEMMAKMYKALKMPGVLVTYCAKGSFKRALRKVHFKVEELPGPPGKREMTRAQKSP